MIPKRYFILVVCCTSFFRCNYFGKGERLFDVTPVEKLNKTEFTPALETQLTGNKNAIYAPSFLFAWDKMKLLFNSPLTANKSPYFNSVNQSVSFKNSLNPDEYSAEAILQGGEIEARGYFSKSLPFLFKLQKLNDGILFGKVRVGAFGMKEQDYKIVNFTQILFYKDDDNFIIQLTPADTLNQIMLVKGLKSIRTLAGAIKQTNDLIKTGNGESHSKSNAWKYKFYPDDSFAIPVIKFNIEAHYKNLEGQTFTASGVKNTIQTAYQRTAFSLNESGAEIESEAFAAADSIAAPVHPKKMFFDEPFFIIIKHMGQANPYFVMKVENAELMDRK